jgi:hypothetical protein
MYRLILAMIGALLLCAPAIAHAEATLYPTRDTLDLAAQRNVVILEEVLFRVTCTSADLGAARIPAEPENHSATSLRVNLSTLPSFSGCVENLASEPVTVTTAGTWTLEFTWASPGAMTIKVPAEGIRMTGRGGCRARNAGATTVRGSLMNGFTSPSFVDSIASWEAFVEVTGGRECDLVAFKLSGTSVKARDASSERAVILLGP